MHERATAVLTRSPVVLEKYGFDIGPLGVMQRRLETGRLPADDIIDCFRETGSLEHVLRSRAGLVDNVDVTPYSVDNGAMHLRSGQGMTETR